ncbi:hypothetical protein OUZ56_014247 [Daphnia magna]|uniref:Uncharacterized protein n=1 Tax=Daphnia magna TaxID=35525 RepID=A0ABQ9Z887_9CRUS|nr:hypothetical protein OUZ56_014247 [Daphnia magna]
MAAAMDAGKGPRGRIYISFTSIDSLRTANYNKMYPPWPLPGIHCGGHFDNAHYLLNQKVYFPTWMENAANTLNANLKLWLSNTV